VVPAIGDHGDAGGKLRVDLALDVIEPVGREQQTERRLPERLVGDRVVAGQHLADQPADRSVAGLTGEVGGDAAIGEMLDQPPCLGGGPCAVESLEDDQPCHARRLPIMPADNTIGTAAAPALGASALRGGT